MLKTALLGMLLGVTFSQAALLRIEEKEHSNVLDGKSFGKAGSYERIVGKAYFAIDPKLPANRAIADIDKALRNKDGMVEFSADVYILRPRDLSKGNGAVLYEVPNRGSKGMLSQFNRAAGSLDPRTPAEFGDNFLLDQGYTLLWVGWQFDLAPQPGLLHFYAPVADGVKGVVRAEIVVDHKELSHSVADRNQKPYAVLNPDDPNLKLTVHDGVEEPRQVVPRSEWHIENGSDVVMKNGFEPGRIYELVYTSSNPPIAGAGFAAVRDTVSYLKYGGSGEIQRAYGWGVSQSGRFLRTYLYDGFNRDEKNRRVFEGMLADVAGGGRGSFNVRFAQPSRGADPTQIYAADLFPFTDLEQTDPATGVTDGLLTHATPPEARPKIFYMNSSHEYYGRVASLIHISLDGKHDAPLAPSTRIYLFSSGQHGPAAFPPSRRDTQNLPNPLPYTWSFRALLMAMNTWVKDGKEPPPSQYPRVSTDQLVALGAVQFPKIPGVNFPTLIHMAYPEDFSQEPPKIGKAYPLLVPQVDSDGNDIAGVRMPEIQVPLATYTGWNLRSKEIGAPERLYALTGSFIPFAQTKAERMKSGDPRPSMEERYSSRGEYLSKFEVAAKSLAGAGYVLPSDVPSLVDRGAAEWDALHR